MQIYRPWSAADATPDFNVISICEIGVNANVTTTSGLPTPRQGHSAALYRGQMVVAGGSNAAGMQLNDVQMLDIASNSWTVVGTISGSAPNAWSLAAMLPSGANNALALFGGSNLGLAVSALNLLSFPACGSYSSFGTTLSCVAAGSTCFATCAAGFVPVSTGPITCGPAGVYLSTVPPCGAPLLEAPPSGSGIAPVVTPLDSQSVSVSWVNVTPANTGYPYAQYINYKVQTQQQIYSFNDFVSGVTPAEWANWQWVDGTGGQQFYSFQSGRMTMMTTGAANCLGFFATPAVMQCAGAYRSLPPQVDPTSYFVEAQVSLDQTNPSVGSMLSGIAIYDTRFNYPALVLGVNGGGVIWRTSIVGNVPLNNLTYPTVFTQTNALTNAALLTVYLRIVFTGGIYTPQYRQSLTASWTPVFSVGSSTLFGGPIPPANLAVGWTGQNWSGKRGLFFLSYLAIGPATCSNPGSVRNVNAVQNPVVISGLSGGTTYAVQVAGVDQYGTGAFTPASTPFVTAAAPIVPAVPVINVALNQPARSNYQYSANTPPLLLFDGITITQVRSAQFLSDFRRT